MNGKLVLTLSLFGLAMAFATVFVIPSTIEPVFWLAIFVFCAVVIARQQPQNPFVHGILTGLLNSVWITGVHVLLFDAYVQHHAREAAMMATARLAPRVMMLVMGPVIGLASGLVLGLFAFIATKLRSRPAPTASRSASAG